MNGPEHYREAERLLEIAANPRRVVTGLDPDMSPAEVERLAKAVDAKVVIANDGVQIHDPTLAAAQVHATLALAAATAEPWVDDTNDRSGNYIHGPWVEVLS